MKKYKINKIKYCLFLITIFVLLQYNLSCNNSQDSVAVLESSDRISFIKAPTFVLEDLNGNKVSSKKYEGKITILSFWATWCKYCLIEIPHLNELYEKYKDKGVEIVGLSFDRRGAKDVIPFLKKVKIDYPILIGNQNIGYRFGGIVGFPTTIVIDRDWKIYQKHAGLTDKKILENDIKQLLANDSAR